jgi:hypothetical protein
MSDTALIRVESGVDCAACHESMDRLAWRSHYRTRAHRDALVRLRQATGYQAAIGQWTQVTVDSGPPWPLHLQMQADVELGRSKYVATLYRPLGAPDMSGAYGISRGAFAQGIRVAAMEAVMQAGTGGSRYWRGESYLGFPEAMRNVEAAFAADRPGEYPVEVTQ